MNARWWFYVKDGQQQSVPALADLVTGLESGEIDASTVIWRQGLREWRPAGSVEELAWFFGGTPQPEPNPPESALSEAAQDTREDQAGEALSPPPLPPAREESGPSTRRPEFGPSPARSASPGRTEARPVFQAASPAVSIDAAAGDSPPGDSISGDLAELPFPDLVQQLQASEFSGDLTLKRDALVKTVTVHEGRIVFAASSDPDDRLGELLLRQGRISLSEYLEAGRAIAPGKRLGTLLVEQGALSPASLVRRVIEQAQEILYSLFLWPSGPYQAESRAPSDDPEAITLRLSTPDIILEGTRRVQGWSRVSAGVGGPDVRYARAEDWERKARRVKKLSDPARELIAAFEDGRSVEAISSSATGLSAFETCQLIWALRVIGVLQRL